jgi:hypothetical protein
MLVNTADASLRAKNANSAFFFLASVISLTAILQQSQLLQLFAQLASTDIATEFPTDATKTAPSSRSAKLIQQLFQGMGSIMVKLLESLATRCWRYMTCLIFFKGQSLQYISCVKKSA